MFMTASGAEDGLAWRTAGGDNSRRGLFPRAARVQSPPARRLEARGAVQAAVVFDQTGRAFVADMAGWVQAFSSEGNLLWRARCDGGVKATPVVHPQRSCLYIATFTGSVCALDTGTGNASWRKEIHSQSDPRILSDILLLEHADLIVVSSWAGRFLAMDAKTGAKRFSWDAGIYPRAAVAADRNEKLHCLRARGANGLEWVRVDSVGNEEVLLREPEDQRGARRALVAAGPVLDEDRGVAYILLNQDKGGHLLACSMQTGAIVWRKPLPSPVQAAPTVLASGMVIVADLAGVLLGFTPEGARILHYQTGCEYLLAGGVGQADGLFFIGDPLGRVHEVDNQGVGRIVFEASRSVQARPSFDPFGCLHVPSTDRSVHVFSVRQG
jgi:outer membrane protein assembly factor BamB